MTRKELEQAAVDYLAKAFKKDVMAVDSVVQAAISVLLMSKQGE